MRAERVLEDVEGWSVVRCERSMKVMKSVISFTKTQDELASVAPLSYSYNGLGTRSIKRAGRSCCEKLEFILPITFHRKPSFLVPSRLNFVSLSQVQEHLLSTRDG